MNYLWLPTRALFVFPGDMPRRVSIWHLTMLAENVRKFGFITPLLISRSGRVIEGRQRFLACRDTLDRFPCIIVDNKQITQLKVELNQPIFTLRQANHD